MGWVLIGIMSSVAVSPSAVGPLKCTQEHTPSHYRDRWKDKLQTHISPCFCRALALWGARAAGDDPPTRSTPVQMVRSRPIKQINDILTNGGKTWGMELMSLINNQLSVWSSSEVSSSCHLDNYLSTVCSKAFEIQPFHWSLNKAKKGKHTVLYKCAQTTQRLLLTLLIVNASQTITFPS